MHQIFYCTIRSFTQLYRNRTYLAIDLFLVFVFGLICGITYKDVNWIAPLPVEMRQFCPEEMGNVCKNPLKDRLNNVGAISSVGYTLTALITSVRMFGTNSALFQREIYSGISPISLFTSKVLSCCVFGILAPYLFISIWHFSIRNIFYFLFFIFYKLK